MQLTKIIIDEIVYEDEYGDTQLEPGIVQYNLDCAIQEGFEITSVNFDDGYIVYTLIHPGRIASHHIGKARNIVKQERQEKAEGKPPEQITDGDIPF